MGRPIVWLRCNRVQCNQSTPERMALYASMIFDEAQDAMAENVDQFFMVYVVEDAGMSNFNYASVKSLMPVLSVSFF